MRKCTTSRRISGTISSSMELPTKRGRLSQNCFKRRQNYFQNLQMMMRIVGTKVGGMIDHLIKNNFIALFQIVDIVVVAVVFLVTWMKNNGKLF